MGGTQVYHRVTPGIKLFGVQLHTSAERGTMALECVLPKNKMSYPSEGDTLGCKIPKTRALTIQPPHLPQGSSSPATGLKPELLIFRVQDTKHSATTLPQGSKKTSQTSILTSFGNLRKGLQTDVYRQAREST